MKLYIQRHGHAPGVGEAGVSGDAERPLSDQGRREVLKLAGLLGGKGGAPLVILASPLKRARQTAAAAAEALKPPRGVRIYEPLSNRLSGIELFKRLSRDHPGLAELMVVGHQPQLGDMVAALTGRTVELRPGGIVALETLVPTGPQPVGTAELENVPPRAENRASLLWSENP